MSSAEDTFKLPNQNIKILILDNIVEFQKQSCRYNQKLRRGL